MFLTAADTESGPGMDGMFVGLTEGMEAKLVAGRHVKVPNHYAILTDTPSS